MSDKPTPLPSVEESLKAVAASVAEAHASIAEGQRYGAETRRILEQMARDSAAWQARHDKNMAEHDKAMADHEQVMAGIKQTLAEASQIAKEANQLAKDALAIMKGVSEQWGGFTNTAGEILEKEVFEALDAAKKIGDIRLVEVVPNLCIANRQYDMLGVNGKTSVLVEVKRSLSVDDVQTFVKKQMKDFPRVFPQFANGGDLVGAMVYHSLRNDNAAKEALDAGLILLRAEGKKGLRQIKTPEAARKPQTAARN